MLPFDRYPRDGKELLPVRNEVNTRHADAPKLQHLSGQTSCAYCGVDLTRDFYRWLLTSIDHVIPRKEGRRLGIPEEWYESLSNAVICCSGCNGFDNQYKVRREHRKARWTLGEFFTLRDLVFKDRKVRIQRRREEEVRFFETQPWSPTQGARR